MTNYRIADARKAKGWSQAEFARLIGTTQQQIARYESNENDVKSSVIIKMSAVLGVSVAYLLGLDETSPAFDHDFERLSNNYKALNSENRNVLLTVSDALAKHQ